MSPERWQRIQDVLEAALERGPDEREAFLTEASAGDPELLAEIRSLVHAHEEAGSFLKSPPVSVPAPASATNDALDQVRRFLNREVGPGANHRAPNPEQPTGADSYVGRAISHYEVLDKLGGGGMGVVYRARDMLLNRIVALKFLSPHLSMDEQAKARFLREARAASALDHVNICTIHEIGETEQGHLFIAMACYAGETLSEKVSRGALPIAEAVDYTLQISRGLAAAHERDIVHRDIKPANVMVTRDGVVKVLDFGLAKDADLNVTKAAAVMGTASYMSPEQARGEPLDHRTDIWSLGVVLYEMIGGQRPFRGAYERAVIYSILHEEAEPISALRKEAPADLDRIVSKALAKTPEARYRAIEELIRDLEHARTSIGGQPTGAGSASPKPGRHVHQAQLLPEGERVQVTVLVSNLGEYIDLVELFSPEDLERLMRQFKESAVDIVQRHGGLLNRFANGEMEMLFGVPVPHEDDCARAARAALELHDWMRKFTSDGLYGQEVRVRSGIDTGLVVAQRPGEEERAPRIAGNTTQTAAALALQASPDEVLVSPQSRSLLVPFFESEDRPSLYVQGRSEPINPSRILRESGIRNRLDAEGFEFTAYTGRDEELSTLRRCHMRALAGEGQVVSVIGEAGLGKSRLLHEFRRGLEQEHGTLLQGRCSSYGGRTPFLPFIEAMRRHLGLDAGAPSAFTADLVCTRIVEIAPELEVYIPVYLHLLSIQRESNPLAGHLDGERLRLAIPEALAAMFTLSARRQPLALLLEDWHWSDEASQDMLGHLVELVPAYPLLVVVTFRPEYADRWGDPLHHTRIRLRPLSMRASTDVMKSVLHAVHLPGPLAVLLHERSGGNPFFLEEICQTLREDGTIRMEEGRVTLTRSLDRLQLPNTVQAIIRMRLHRLDLDARRLIRLASVVGREFTRRLLQHILEEDASLTPALDALRSAGLILQTRVLPEATYRFNHVLTQEVAYESLLQHQRKMLHGQVGEAIEALHLTDGQAERVSHHFGVAGRWRKAIHYGRRAAREADAAGQYEDALAMIEQVHKWVLHLPKEPGEKRLLVEVLLEKERLYERRGDRSAQEEIISELFSLIDSKEDPVKAVEVYVREGDLNILRGRYDEAERSLSQALQISQDSMEDNLRRRALRSIGFLSWRQGNVEKALTILEDLMAASKREGNWTVYVNDLASMSTLLRTHGEYESALEHISEALSFSESLPPMQRALVYEIAGDLYRSMGDYEKALHFYQSVLALDRPIAGKHSFTLLGIGNIYFEQGKIDECLRMYQKAVAWGRKSGSTDELADALRMMGGAMVALERHEEAVSCLQEAAGILSMMEDPEAEAFVRSQLAVVQEKSNLYPEAAASWERARSLNQQAENRIGEIDAIEGLARTARLLGDPALARHHYRESVEMAERLDDHARLSKLHNSVGILEWELGEYESALEHYEEALRVCRDRDDHTHAGLMLNSIGVTLWKLHRYEEATTYLDEAIGLHRRKNEKLLEAHALAALGDICLERNLLDEALHHYGASLQLRWDLNDRKGEGWMLHRLARVYLAQNESERARNSVKQAAEIAFEIKDEELLKACRNLSG